MSEFDHAIFGLLTAEQRQLFHTSPSFRAAVASVEKWVRPFLAGAAIEAKKYDEAMALAVQMARSEPSADVIRRIINAE